VSQSQIIADRIRAAELELQFARRAFDGSEQARDRYQHALEEMMLAQRQARLEQRAELQRTTG